MLAAQRRREAQYAIQESIRAETYSAAAWLNGCYAQIAIIEATHAPNKAEALRHTAEAYTAANRAAHWAGRALDALWDHDHDTSDHDAHCTCNDCLTEHAAQQEQAIEDEITRR